MLGDEAAIAAFQPATDDERMVAAGAVAEERERIAGNQLVEALSDREKLLLEHAWAAGAKAARDALLERLNNPQAVTLDAAAVAKAIVRWHDHPRIFELPAWPGLPDANHDPRVIAVVRVCDRVLEVERRHAEIDGS